jgi:hypothetical protein
MYILERGEDNGRAALGGQNCSIYAVCGPGSLDAAALRTAQVRRWYITGYFIDDAQIPSIFNYLIKASTITLFRIIPILRKE